MCDAVEPERPAPLQLQPGQACGCRAIDHCGATPAAAGIYSATFLAGPSSKQAVGEPEAAGAGSVSAEHISAAAPSAQQDEQKWCFTGVYGTVHHDPEPHIMCSLTISIFETRL